MAGAWEGQLVTTTVSLAGDLIAALLDAGARAVIARRPGTPSPPAADAVAFFEALYDQLLAGRTILEVNFRMQCCCCCVLTRAWRLTMHMLLIITRKCADRQWPRLCVAYTIGLLFGCRPSSMLGGNAQRWLMHSSARLTPLGVTTRKNN